MSELSKVILDYFGSEDMEINQIMTEIDNAKIDVVKEYLDRQGNDSVYVIKKSGTIEQYNQDKILRSIKNAADEKGQQLNTSDLNVILEDIAKSMKDMDRKVFRTDEIKEYVRRSLIDEGFSQIYDSYASYIKI